MLPSTILYVEDDEEYSTSKWYAASLIYCKNSSPGKYKILKSRYSNHPRGSIVDQDKLDKLIKITWGNDADFELWKAIRDGQ
jgi:hypothetical protein